MSSTPTWELPLPADGQQPWGDDYRAAMMTIDERLGGLRGSLFVEDNTAPTPIAEQGTAVPIVFGAGEVQAGPFCRFCEIGDDGTITYVGPLDRVPTVQLSFTLQSPSANKTLAVSVRKNGEPIAGSRTRVRYGPNVTIASGSCVFNVEVSTGDTLQAFVTNLSGTDDPTMLDMTFAARG